MTSDLSKVGVNSTMQIFLPSPSFNLAASFLDNKRLNKQRLEAIQILTALREGSRWSNHPAVRMWNGHEVALMAYYNACSIEWSKRGYAIIESDLFTLPCTFELPHWIGNHWVTVSHRSNLIRKDPVFYGKYWPHLTPHIPYFWPVEVKCKKTGRYDEYSKMWVKINSKEQEQWYRAYLLNQELEMVGESN